MIKCSILRAEHQWSNLIICHKREHEINKLAHSFAGRKHLRKLTRFNATREANESCRVLYPLEAVVKVVTDALRNPNAKNKDAEALIYLDRVLHL